MMNLYRRHATKCPHRKDGQDYTACSCPIWAYGELDGKIVRRSVGARDWARAGKRIAKWEEKPRQLAAPKSVKAAIESYLGDCRARKLKESTVMSYSNSLEHLRAFCEGTGITAVDQIDLGTLTGFRAGRKVAASTSAKELEALRAFCAFALDREWMDANHAKKLSPIRVDGSPTMPFTQEQIEKILEACGHLRHGVAPVEFTRAKARAFCFLLLYSGLRISDAVQVRRTAVDLGTGKLLLRIMKTGVMLYVRLGQPAVDALAALPLKGEYFFWSGKSKLATATGKARHMIERVLSLAKVKGHPHRFRDTFSVRLLEKGEDIRTVQLLLGHASLQTTEKHYAPYIESFQRILDAATAKLDFMPQSVYKNVQKRRFSGTSGLSRAS